MKVRPDAVVAGPVGARLSLRSRAGTRFMHPGRAAQQGKARCRLHSDVKSTACRSVMHERWQTAAFPSDWQACSARRRRAAACRRSRTGIRPIAATSTSASRATAPGSIRARRSAARNWCGCSRPSCARTPDGYHPGHAGREDAHRGRGRAVHRRAAGCGGRGARRRSSTFTTNVGDETVAGADNPIRVETDPRDERARALCACAQGSGGADRARACSISSPIWPCRARASMRACSACGAAACSFRLGRPRMSERNTGRDRPSHRQRRRRAAAQPPAAEPPALPLMPTRSDYDLNPQNRPQRAARADAGRRAAAASSARSEPHVLFTQRTAHLPRHAGQVSFPGGRADPDDISLVETALARNAGGNRHRAGLRHRRGLSRCLRDRHGLRDPAGRRPAQRRLRAGAAMPTRWRRFSRCRWPSCSIPPTASSNSREWQGRSASFYAFTYEGHYIWGATAAMLVNFGERITAP